MGFVRIKTKKQYKEYLIRFSKVFHAKEGTKEGDEAESLACFIKDYEDRHFPIGSPVKK